MAGAMAGTALLEAPMQSERLDTIALTVNNTCNLECPHCYLQYLGEQGNFIGSETVDALFEAKFRHICIVGKEPLSNSRSIDICNAIIGKAWRTGHTVSMITNGLKLNRLSAEILAKVAWIDVSLDGGRNSYHLYRGANIENVISNIAYVRDISNVPIRILNTICRENIAHLLDMLAASEEINPEYTMFSPYRQTNSHGDQSVRMLSPYEFLDAMSQVLKGSDKSFLVSIDANYLSKFSIDTVGFLDAASEVLGERLCRVDNDPITRGLVRLTYDGLVMSPFDSIDTVKYNENAMPLSGGSLENHFQTLLQAARPMN